MQKDRLVGNISFINVFGLYLSARLYFFLRQRGAPIEARSFLPIIVGCLFVLLGAFIEYYYWVKIVGLVTVMATIVYAVTGYFKMKKGLLPVDNKNIKYTWVLIEIFIVFILSLVVATLLGLDYFRDRF